MKQETVYLIQFVAVLLWTAAMIVYCAHVFQP